MKRMLLGEFLGTALLVFFGCGSVAAAVTTGAQVGIFEVAIVWGLGIAIAIGLTAPLSGAHLNPAVTLAAAIWKKFPSRLLLPYWFAQLTGAFFAAILLHLIFSDSIHTFEKRQGVIRGTPGSEASAMVYGEYFPNPEGKALTPDSRERMTASRAFFAEVVGTALLVLVIFGLESGSPPVYPPGFRPVLIGLTVTLLISLLGPLTMCCLNPARDLGPRLFSSLAGWGSIPFTVNGSGWLTVYLIAPLLGGVLGGAIFQRLLAEK